MKADFISDDKLRRRIENSAEYILALYIEARSSKYVSYQSETYRVIILYCVSIIEALLYEIHNQLEEKITKTEYKDVYDLPQHFKNTEFPEGTVAVAVRCVFPKKEVEISFNELLTFLKDKVLKPETVERIKVTNSLRNTFHLRKDGNADCTIQDVEEALFLLELTLKHTPRFMKMGKSH